MSATQRQPLTVDLPHDVSGELLAIGRSVDLDMPHAEASHLILKDVMGRSGLIEATRDALAPIREKASFAYTVKTPFHPVGELHPKAIAHTARAKALTFAHALGSLGTTPYEEAGAPLSLVTPAVGYEHTQSYRGSDDPLLFHQEMLPHPGSTTREALTRFVILSGVSDTTPPTATMVAPIQESLTELSDTERKLLGLPIYTLRPYDAMKQTGEEVVAGAPEPVLHRDGQVVLDFADIETDNPEAQAALRHFLETTNKHAIGVTLLPGETSIVDNRNAFHGRGAIPNGHGKRLLIRAHSVGDYHPHAHKG